MFNKLAYTSLLSLLFVALLASCSTQLEPDEQLYTGLKPIKYSDYEPCTHFDITQAEVDAALATAPNGALFGSSYYRTPFPYGLWVYNAFNNSTSGFGKWMLKSFGTEPVVMSNVNPELRISVAKNVLQNYGYFRGDVDYDIIYGKFRKTKTDTVARPRTAKIQYKVNPGHLFAIDTVTYSNFPDSIFDIDYTSGGLLKPGDPFNISALDNERTRLYRLFRNHGYYYYEQPYTSYIADTLNAPGKVKLRLQLIDSLPNEATMRWIIGRNSVNIRRQYDEELKDSVGRRYLTIHFTGKRSPIRPSVILQNIQVRPGQLFSEDTYMESLNRLASNGVFSSVGIEFVPRKDADGTLRIVPDTVGNTKDTNERRAGAGVLDMNINCVLDKPYDLTLQANYLGKTSGRMGPGLSVGLAKRNAFRGGELLSLNLGASYEFQTGGDQAASNSYEYSGDLALSIPRLLLPSFISNKRRRWYLPPSTTVSLNYETINRSGFFLRNIFSAELSYTVQPSQQSRHVITPLILEYDRMAELSNSYAEMAQSSAVLLASLDDYYLQKMRYQYAYTSPTNYRNPIYWSTTITESCNLLSLGYAAFGKSLDARNKKTFKIPFAQFIKLETEWRKTWQLSEYQSVVAHVQAGVIKTYGNSSSAPHSEYFYIGGANSLRSFTARSLGPGAYHNPTSKYSYLTNVGDMKLVMNLEYRPRLFGSLYGAIFLDAGNIWNIKDESVKSDDEEHQSYLDGIVGDPAEGQFRLKNFFSDLAVGVGIGIRYDLDFFVLRVDWGYAIHAPYHTGYNGYFNMRKFKNAQCLNFAIGYPF